MEVSHVFKRFEDRAKRKPANNKSGVVGSTGINMPTMPKVAHMQPRGMQISLISKVFMVFPLIVERHHEKRIVKTRQKTD